MENRSGFDRHAVLVANSAGIIELWGGGAEKLFGYSAGEAVGQSLDLIVAEPYREQHWIGFRRAMESGISSLDGQSFDLPVQHRNGTAMAVKGQLVLLRDSVKSPIGAMAILAVPD
jgi:hypothetical protein